MSLTEPIDRKGQTIAWLKSLYEAGGIDILEQLDFARICVIAVRIPDKGWVECWMPWVDLANALPRDWILERLYCNTGRPI